MIEENDVMSRFIHQGAVYRLAGQLQQVPSWEEMWKEIQNEKDLEEEAVLIADGDDDPEVLDGVWWHERLDVLNLSAPRGVIVPSRLKWWSVQKGTEAQKTASTDEEQYTDYGKESPYDAGRPVGFQGTHWVDVGGTKQRRPSQAALRVLSRMTVGPARAIVERFQGRTAATKMNRDEAVVLREDADHWFEIEAVNFPIGPQGPGWYIAWFNLSSLLANKRTGAGQRYYKIWESQLPPSVRFLYLYALPRPRRFWKAMGYTSVYHPRDNTVPNEARALLVKDLTGAPVRHATYYAEEFAEIEDFYGKEVEYVPTLPKVATMPPDYLYHVSLLIRLDSIATSGLFPGRSENWPGYSGHAQGRVFLTEEGAVNGWIHKVTYSAAMESDYPVEEGFIPVVLRVPVQQVEALLRPDEVGSRDVPEGESFYVEDGIAPDELEVYTPKGWVYVEEVDTDEMRDYALKNSPRDRDDGEEYVLLDEYVFAPDPGAHRRRYGWGETVNTVLVHTCGRNSIEPECEGAKGFSLLPTGKMPRSKRSKKKTKKGNVLVIHKGKVYRPYYVIAKSSFKRPTDVMIAFFEKRTREHIGRVVKFMKMLDGFTSDTFSYDDVIERAKVHDEDKYADPELILPYIWVTEYHRVNNDKGSVPDWLQEQYDLAKEATGRHVEKNLHHPEAHDAIEDMTELDLAEMVCDWAAMAEELGEGSPRGWADKNIGSKWKFSDEQEKYIYSVIDWLEGKGKK